jgi:type IV secretion system protein VirB10
MAEFTDSENVAHQPQLNAKPFEPKGVLRKNLKTLVYLGAALLVILAAVFSASGKKPNTKQASKGQPPQPIVQDNTDNNVADLKNQLQTERQKQQQQQATLAAATATTPAQQAAVPYSTGAPVCVPGQPCPQSAYVQQTSGGGQLSTVQEQEQQLAAKEKELAFNARFTSNLVYAAQAQLPGGRAQVGLVQGMEPDTSRARPESTLVSPRAAGEQTEKDKRAPEVNIDTAVGQPYVIYEGMTLDTVLMNRLDGDAAGPVKVMVSNPLYSHDYQHVLIPDGTIVLGEAKKIGTTGFGQQRRMAVVFHRMIMPDGYSVDLDQFNGLDQIGQEGLKDKVNNHYLQIFGTSIALGVISGAAEITQGGGTISTSGSQAFTTGAAAGVSQSATTILDRFIQIPPTITIREGHRVKVYFTQDMLLPAYSNHTIPQSF